MSHYFSEEQKGPMELGMLQVRVCGLDLELYTASGIFSWKKIDRGTMVLMENMEARGGFLDLGCGIGVVGIVAAKLGAKVTMSDVNRRAVKVAKMNVKKMGIEATVVNSSLYEGLGRFDVIASNPPISAGMDICCRIIDEAPAHLNPGGKLFIVARHRIAGRRLMGRMEEVFGNCEVIERSGGFWVYCSKRIKGSVRD